MAKTYLRKNQVADRYRTTPRNVDRMAVDGRIPAPAFHMAAGHQDAPPGH